MNDYDCIMVACSSSDFESDSVTYPAKYGNTIAVGATDSNDILWDDSNYGSQLDVVAPHVVPTTTTNGGYITNFNGTSAATPHVAGIAALIRSVDPGLSWDVVRNVIRMTADKVDGMNGEDFTIYYGYGRVNAYYAVAPPAAPTNLTVSSYQGNPKLTWNPNSEPDLDHYKIWKKYINIFEGQPGYWHSTATTTQTNWTDTNVNYPGGRPPDIIRYMVTAIDIAGFESDYSDSVQIIGEVIYWPMPKQVVENSQIPVTFSLSENFPNPFNPTTVLKYDLPEDAIVRLIIYDLMGRKVKTLISGTETAGFKEVIWEGTDSQGQSVSSGMYLFRLETASLENGKSFSKTGKMVLLR